MLVHFFGKRTISASFAIYLLSLDCFADRKEAFGISAIFFQTATPQIRVIEFLEVVACRMPQLQPFASNPASCTFCAISNGNNPQTHCSPFMLTKVGRRRHQ
jgi:hypothetical protein